MSDLSMDVTWTSKEKYKEQKYRKIWNDFCANDASV
jgi:hypothetical protein